MGYELIEVAAPDDWTAYHAIRKAELFDRRHPPIGYDFDHPDDGMPQHHNYLLKLDGRPIGVTRLDLRPESVAIFRLVAITAPMQGQGHGRVLSEMVEAKAKAFGCTTLWVNAAKTAVGYYYKTGWSEHEWDAEERIGIAIECTQMRKQL
ncbi:GNAT family N-acetyltransferase [Devosia sp.]|uniref:GNAT family N-acetyltransferase n=1 Tax=Devosia sp. TaxID=1871048 RepID=UPI0032679ADE